MVTLKQCDRCKEVQRVLGHEFATLEMETGNDREEGLKAELCPGCQRELRRFAQNLPTTTARPTSVVAKNA